MTTDCSTQMKRYRDKEILQELYVEKGLSTTEIADKLDCGSSTVATWLKKNNIKTRSRVEGIRKRFSGTGPSISTDGQGYEMFQVRNNIEESVLKHHRLLALLKYSPCEIKNMDIHHKNECPWDNRVENLEPMSRSEHTAHHCSKDK